METDNGGPILLITHCLNWQKYLQLVDLLEKTEIKELAADLLGGIGDVEREINSPKD